MIKYKQFTFSLSFTLLCEIFTCFQIVLSLCRQSDTMQFPLASSSKSIAQLHDFLLNCSHFYLME